LNKLEPEITAVNMEMKGEALKIYKCTFEEKQRKEINSIFTKEKMKTVTDYYAASLINQNLEENKYTDSGYRTMLKDKIESDWIKNFNAETFKFGNSNGVTLETIKLIELLHHSKDASDKVSTAIKTLIKQASSTSADNTSENQIFFLAPKIASELDLT
jgi:hypothetical protein